MADRAGGRLEGLRKKGECDTIFDVFGENTKRYGEGSIVQEDEK